MPPVNRRIPGARLATPAPESAHAIEDAVAPSEKAETAAKPERKPPSARARRIWSIVRATTMTLLVAGASIGAAAGARHYVTTSPRFALTAVDVSGATRRTPDDVAREAGLEKGTNVFLVDVEAARDRLLADPWFKDATVARQLPGTAKIAITERDAAALVALGDLYIATANGEIFKRWEAGDPIDLPMVTGLASSDVADDREGAARSIRRALDVVAEYEHMPMAAKAPVEEVHLTSGDAVSLTVGKSGTMLALGQPPYRKKFEEAARAMAEIDRRGGKADAVLLDNEVHPERVVVRLK